MKVVVAHRPPFVFATNTTTGPIFSGLLIDLLNRILLTGNVTYQYHLYVSEVNAGGTEINGTWNGVVGELVAKRADVALFPLTRTAARLAAVDCTYSYYDAGLALLVGDGKAGPGPLSVLAPFSGPLWITLLFTVIGVALLFWALDAYGKWIRNKQLNTLQVSGMLSDEELAQAKNEDYNPVMMSFMAAAGAPERPGRNSWGVQVLYVVYCFFCVIVLSSYTANLTSYLAVRRAYVDISGLQDLVRSNALVGVNPSGSTAAYFIASKDSLAMQLQQNVLYCDTTTCVEWVRKGVVRAFITDKPVLTYLSQRQPCDVRVLGDSFGPGNLVIGLQKNSSLLPFFNAALQTFAEDGTLTSLRRTWFDGMSQCDGSDAELDSTRLTINQMIGAFVLLAIGILIAFATGTVENLKWCIARAYSRSSCSEHSARTLRTYTVRNSDGQLPRNPSLLRQAFRLRTSAWHRISVALLGFAKPQLGATEDRSSPPASLQGRRTQASITSSQNSLAKRKRTNKDGGGDGGDGGDDGDGDGGGSGTVTATATDDGAPPQDVVLVVRDSLAPTADGGYDDSDGGNDGLHAALSSAGSDKEGSSVAAETPMKPMVPPSNSPAHKDQPNKNDRKLPDGQQPSGCQSSTNPPHEQQPKQGASSPPRTPLIMPVIVTPSGRLSSKMWPAPRPSTYSSSGAGGGNGSNTLSGGGDGDGGGRTTGSRQQRPSLPPMLLPLPARPSSGSGAGTSASSPQHDKPTAFRGVSNTSQKSRSSTKDEGGGGKGGVTRELPTAAAVSTAAAVAPAAATAAAARPLGEKGGSGASAPASGPGPSRVR